MDRSGVVHGPFNVTGYLTFDDLDLFTQGYVEALLTAHRHGALLKPGHAGVSCGFSDLAPETLARIVEDCGRFQRLPDWKDTARDAELLGRYGRDFWAYRNAPNAGECLFKRLASAFPPLSAYLGDDGKVYLRAAAQ